MSQFQKGDLVKLKSGGPVMTVEEVGDYSGGWEPGPADGVNCIWFADAKSSQQVQQRVFDACVLEKA